MGVRIRASTQIFDDTHLLLTADDIYRINNAVLSEPESGEQRVYAIKRLPDGTFIIDWESIPEP